MKDVKLADKTHARLASYARKDQTFNDVIVELLGETKLLPTFIERLEKAIKKGELAKKDTAHNALAYEALDHIITASKELIAEIQKR